MQGLLSESGEIGDSSVLADSNDRVKLDRLAARDPKPTQIIAPLVDADAMIERWRGLARS